MAKGGDSKKKQKEDSEWVNVRQTATRTEVLTRPDLGAQELLQQASKSDPSLIAIQGDMMGKVFRLKEGRTVIGRHPSCDIPVSQRAVSAFHLEIRKNGNVIVVEDLKSTNGSMLNNSKIESPHVLNPGDLVRVGSAVFKYINNSLDTAFSESLHQKVTRDSLTGVFNKAYVYQALQSSMDIAKTGYPLSIIMLDLDHFKKVNDTHGHVAGDFVLKETCRVLLDSVIRSEDILGRFGGEEFIIIMPDATKEVAFGVAERIRKTIQDHRFDFSGTTIPVTASLGVCSWGPQHTSVDTFVGSADQLLYASKQGGRNKVSVS